MDVLERVNRVVWGMPALILLLTVGVVLSICTRFVQIRLFPIALKKFLAQFKARKDYSGTSPYSALCTALAATVGTGNIVGVAGAITLGGPGAIFWMWLCALLGMAIKFAEAALAVRFQITKKNGDMHGGPMYMILHGMGNRWYFLSVIYCLLGLIASFGVGNTTQVSAVLMAVRTLVTLGGGATSVSLDLLVGVVVAGFTGVVLLGGARRVGDVAEKLVPIAAICYLVLCFAVLFLRFGAIPSAFLSIITGAFHPEAVTGGVLGSVFLTLRIGMSRGTFTNEAGMGTASIAHGSAKVSHPIEQGLMGMIEVFLDTILMCTMTALVILCSGIPVNFGVESGELLAGNAFCSVLGSWSIVPLTTALSLFAIATIIGWSMYGARCAQFLFGENSWRVFVWCQMVVMVGSVFMSTGSVWMVSETMNGLMLIPNLIALICLSPELTRLVKNTGVHCLYSGKFTR